MLRRTAIVRPAQLRIRGIWKVRVPRAVVIDVLALLALSFVSCSKSPAEPEARRPISSILYLGNSLTLHGPEPAIGWAGNWGMAASDADHDFAHLLSARFPTASHTESGVPGFEQVPAAFVLSTLDHLLQPSPDVIVVELGDNAIDPIGFASGYRSLIAHLSSGGSLILCVSTWWEVPAVNAGIASACARDNTRYVDISGLYANAANRAETEQHFADSGVGAHPGDRGMRLIADALYGVLSQGR